MQYIHYKSVVTKCLPGIDVLEICFLMVTLLAIATCRFIPHSFALASSVSFK